MAVSKKTLIIGATPDEGKYANLAANRLVSKGHEIINIGIKKGAAAGVAIEQAGSIYADVDTITLYIGPQHQSALYSYILNTNPKRLIFNPGTENTELSRMARAQGIETLFACTLVMLATGEY